jgi:hypothetical protein
MYVLSVCLLQKRARSLELAPDQIRNQLVFNNPQQHAFRGGAQPGDPSFFNSYSSNENSFYREQQRLPSFTGSSTNLDKQFVAGQQISATTYKPTLFLPRHQQQNQFQYEHGQQQATHNSPIFQAPSQQRGASIEVFPSVSLSNSFPAQPPPPQQTFNNAFHPPQQTFNNAFQHPQDPRFYNNAQTQQANVFRQPNPSQFTNQAANFQHGQQLQEQNRRNGVADSRIHANQVPNSSYSRVNLHGPFGGQSFVHYK